MKKNFIKATEGYCSREKHIAAPYMRRSFELDFAPSSAKLSICGLGFYCLYINGKEITKGYLAPYISNPDDICYYDSYDIADLLVKGKNTVGIILGNGFMNSLGGYVWEGDKSAWRGAPRVAMELLVEADGYENVVIEADTEFKVGPSPICFDDIHYGEYYDARNTVYDW